MGSRTLDIVRVTESNYLQFQALANWRATGVRAVAELPAPNDRELSFASRDDYWVWAAEVDGDMVGWIAYVLIPKPDRRVGMIYVDELWTAPEYRRLGVAELLMQKAIATAQELNLWKIRLYVGKDNPAARAFYRKMGFIEDEQEAMYCQRNP